MSGRVELEQDLKTVVTENNSKLSPKEVLGKLGSHHGVSDPGSVLLDLIDRGDLQVTIDWKVRLGGSRTK